MRLSRLTPGWFYSVHAGAAIYFDLARYFSAIGAAFGCANAAVARSDNRC